MDAPSLPACLAAARATRPGTRRPVVIDGETVGSVALAQLDALGAWPQWVHIGDTCVELTLPAAERDAALAVMHRQLQAQGRLRGWRDESFAIVSPHTGRVLARIERAAARFWGTLSFGAHANGYLSDDVGRPTKVWIARRALDKATDPGLYDNLVGGGVPHGELPLQTLLREGAEEAGLAAPLGLGAQPAGGLRVSRDVPEGLQHEHIHVFDLALPPDWTPHNEDGEVESFALLEIAEVRALAWGCAMTMDAALVTIDFLHRHRLIEVDGLDEALQSLHDAASARAG